MLAESELRTADNQEALSRAQEARRGMEAAEAGKEAALASAHEEALRVQESLSESGPPTPIPIIPCGGSAHSGFRFAPDNRVELSWDCVGKHAFWGIRKVNPSF